MLIWKNYEAILEHLVLPDLRSGFWLPVRPDQTGSSFLTGTDQQVRIRSASDSAQPKFKE